MDPEGPSNATTLLQALSQRHSTVSLDLLAKLLDIQACPRCCMRFAGMRSAAYADPAPGHLGVLNALSKEEDASGSTDTPCPICLGILQRFDAGGCHRPSDAVTSAVHHTDGSPESWIPLTSCSASAVADAIRKEGHELGASFALDITVPGATQVRQQAAWHWLRRDASCRSCLPGHSPSVDVTDLKSALRLALAEPLAKHLQMTHKQDAALHVTLLFVHPATASEADFLFESNRNGRGAKRKRGSAPVQLGRVASEGLATAAAKMMEFKFGQHVRIPPLPPAQASHCFLQVRRDALYVGGYYRKLQRDVSQSPFILDGVRKGRTSVQEEIEKVVLPHMRCNSSKFITAGREDMDVKMLGDGRPFVMEISNARAQMPSRECFTRAENELNASGVGVEVKKLQPVDKAALKHIKAGEQEKQKSYLARCRLPCPVTEAMLAKLNSTKGLLLKQQTPTRVEHRRSMLVREKLVHTMSAAPVDADPRELMLQLRVQAGTYIKEFVHGDNGRTLPNLGSLLGCEAPAEILSLDVLQVHMEFL